MAVMAKDRKRAGKPHQIYLDETLTEAMGAYLDEAEPRITKTAYIESLIRNDLRARGKWPPPAKKKPKPADE